jgi:hypothetical protein
MTDKLIFQLHVKWAVLCDEAQWIIARKRTRSGKECWRAIAFVATTKLVLMRVIDELNFTPTREAQRTLDQLPESFRLWLADQDHKLPDRPRVFSGRKWLSAAKCEDKGSVDEEGAA